MTPEIPHPYEKHMDMTECTKCGWRGLNRECPPRDNALHCPSCDGTVFRLVEGDRP